MNDDKNCFLDSKALINGIECMVFEAQRVDEAPEGYPHRYDLRHSDNGDFSVPATAEKFVAVNFFGTCFAKKPFNLNEEGYAEIKSLEYLTGVNAGSAPLPISRRR